MKKIIYELNEVPKKLFDFYAKMFPESGFGHLLSKSFTYETHTADVGGLHPWVTWPTLHRGISNVDHEISDLGQDLKKVNVEYPSIFNFLANNNIKVGVFGSLHSYPLPESFENYKFYVPDTFAAGNECFPNKLSAFQTFNLSMVKQNGRNVSKGIAVKDAFRFIAKAQALGLKWPTFINLGKQVLDEQINKDRVVRRRTSQVEISFDLFYQQLIETKPEICFFFTNHVASSMHRYWPTIFPEDYEKEKINIDWIERWKNEIPHAVKVANAQIKKLMSFCENNNYELIVCSSMGQGAVENIVHVKNQVLITKIKKLLNYLNIKDSEWEPRLSMAPQVVIKPLTSSVEKKLRRLKKISINGKNIRQFITSTGDIRLDIKVENIDEISIYESGSSISPDEIGVEKINIQDASKAFAYHIPQGVLLHYNPLSLIPKRLNREWEKISVLDVAPSLIKSFNKKVPGYMKGDASLFNN